MIQAQYFSTSYHQPASLQLSALLFIVLTKLNSKKLNEVSWSLLCYFVVELRKQKLMEYLAAKGKLKEPNPK